MMQIAPLRFLQSCRLQVAVKPSWSAGAAAQYKPGGHWQRCAGQRRAAGNRNSAPDEAPVCSVCRRHQRRVVLQGGRELNAEALHCRRERTNAGSRTLSVLVGRFFGAAASIAAVSYLQAVVRRGPVEQGGVCRGGQAITVWWLNTGHALSTSQRPLGYASAQCSRPRLCMNLLPGVLRSSAAGTCIALHQRSRVGSKRSGGNYPRR